MTTRGRLLVLSLNAAPEQSGNAPYVTMLVNGLAEVGWSVRLISAHPHYPQWQVREGYGQWRRVDVEHGVRIERLRHYVPRNPSGMRRLLSEISFGLRLWGARWARPDVVVLVSPAMFSSAIAMARARLLHRGIPTVVWVQDLYSRGMAQTRIGGGVSRALVQKVESALLRAADRTVVIHERFRRIVVESLDTPCDRVTVVRNWSHMAASPGSTSESEVRAALGWSPDEIVVVHGGNQGVKQGLQNVVAAAKLADRSDAPVRFVLLGNGSQHDALRAAARGVRRIQFLGSMANDDYIAALRSADVLLVNELIGVKDMAVPSKLTTYFHAGRPVIAASDEGSICAEEVERAGAGVRVDPGSPAALLAAAIALGADRSHGDRLGESGATFARENLRTEAALQAFDEVLVDLVGTPPRAAVAPRPSA